MAVSKSLRFQVLRRDNFTCRYCGRGAPEVALTVDHVVAEALGGRDEPSNLVAACADCNGGKAATPADAAMVSDVEADAVRWARAISVAAGHMMQDLRAREADQDAFAARWGEWTSTYGMTPPLPSDWRLTVDRFMATGLPREVLLECIDRAMTNRKIRHAELFRYMCGIAWARVSELHESARDATATRHPTPTPIDRLIEQLTAALQSSLGGHELEDLLARAKESLGERDHDADSPGAALVQCVELLVDDLNDANGWALLLGHIARKSVPAGKLNALVEATTVEMRSKVDGGEWTMEEFEFNLAYNAIVGLGELAKRAGGAA